ncbi:hypothetical protein B0O80DRAFT_503867 [Mortierella sp. GBAus27b]|nr:hypothetical protein B0O80DRAFT_503867 [Mortierella sp. GBAus27b]
MNRIGSSIASWAPPFSQLIQLYFIIIATTAFLAATLPPLRDSILTYGKLDSPSSPSSSKTQAQPSSGPSRRTRANHGPIIKALGELRVPKTWFAHFYVFATLWVIYLSLDLLLYVQPTLLESSSSSSPLSYLPDVLTSSYPSWSFLSLLNLLGVMPHNPASELPSVPGSGSDSGSGPGPRLEAWIPAPSTSLAMTCYLAHVLRRWYESWFIERPSAQARLHVGHYLVGVSFYAAIAPSFWVDSYECWVNGVDSRLGQHHEGHPYRHLHHSRHHQEAKDNSVGYDWLGRTMNNWQCLLGLGLFLWGSWHQHRCHVILANLRKPSSSQETKSTKSATQEGTKETTPPQEYKVPFGDWFEYLVTPHYSAEMVLYFGFYLMVSSESPATTLLFAWVWVVVNLGIIARETDQWYKSRFGPAYAGTLTTAAGQSLPKRRAILIPFVY